jgi:hypothetical protein
MGLLAAIDNLSYTFGSTSSRVFHVLDNHTAKCLCGSCNPWVKAVQHAKLSLEYQVAGRPTVLEEGNTEMYVK